MNNEILDQPENKPEQKIWLIIGAIGVGLLAIGLLMRFMHWPGALLPIGLSLVLMGIRSIALFRNSQKNLTTWLYIAGHLLLAISLVLFYTGTLMHPGLFILPALAYLVGLIVADRKNKESE